MEPRLSTKSQCRSDNLQCAPTRITISALCEAPSLESPPFRAESAHAQFLQTVQELDAMLCRVARRANIRDFFRSARPQAPKVTIPRQSRGLSDCEPLEAADGDANASPVCWPLRGASQRQRF